MYEAVTQGIRVRVTPQYLEEESSPHEGRYVWAYTVDIRNEGSETVQLRSGTGASPTPAGAPRRCAAAAWSGRRR